MTIETLDYVNAHTMVNALGTNIRHILTSALLFIFPLTIAYVLYIVFECIDDWKKICPYKKRVINWFLFLYYTAFILAYTLPEIYLFNCRKRMLHPERVYKETIVSDVTILEIITEEC